MPEEESKLAQERLRRFERLGGVDLSGLAPEEQRPLLTTVEVGTAELKKVVFTFRCPLCHNTVRSNQEMPPACTGPTWLDEHPLEVMELVSE